MGNGPKQEQNGKSCCQSRHYIDHNRNPLYITTSKLGKEITQQHEEWRTGRMGYFKFVGCNNTLAAIPEAGGRLNG